MPNFRYRALTQGGEIVSGLIAAPNAAEVIRRIEYLRLVPVDTALDDGSDRTAYIKFGFAKQAGPEDVTIFTVDLALTLKAGARLEEALELLANDTDIGRLRSTILKIRSSVLSGESFADALLRHTTLFSPMYVALVRVGETSGKLEQILEMLAGERSRAEALRRKLADAIRYPAFLLFAASCTLVFFLMFVIPQFAIILHDFRAKVDPIATFFLGLSAFLTQHKELLGALTATLLLTGFFLLRRPDARAQILAALSHMPLARSALAYHRTALFCRNLGLLLAAGVPLTTTLRVLADMMAATGQGGVWRRVVEQVRQGRKLSDAISEAAALPAMAVRMLRLGEETGQLPVLAGRIAEFYETKLQRNLDRIVGMVGPLAVIGISVIVGGLIISVMTALLSVSQVVG